MRYLRLLALSSTCIATVAAASVISIARRHASITVPASSRLHNGWNLTPAGVSERVGDTLLGCALSPDRKMIAMTNAGYGDHHLYIVDAEAGKVVQALPIARAWNGVAWSADSTTIYVSGGGAPRIHVFHKGADGTFAAATSILLSDLAANPPEEKERKEERRTVDKNKGQAYVSGLAISKYGSTLYAANFASDTIYAVSLPDGVVQQKRTLDAGSHPYCLRLSPDGKFLYATLTPDRSIAVLKADSLELTRTIRTDSHPNDLLFAPDGRLFVSCGNSDTVLVVDPATGETKERVSVSLTPSSPPGATPDALALAPDGKTLYVADADNNDVAVVDVSRAGHSRVRGFIPTGWYPSVVSVSPDGKNLFIGSGKGMGTGPSAGANVAQDAVRKNENYVYIADLLYGMISTVPIPDDAHLAAYTRQVLANTPYRDNLLKQARMAARNNPIPARPGAPSPIKHILYIIKENRTYDQVFGDFKDKTGKQYGNGEPSLTLFGESVTPNIHELARQYVLLDNLYCSGEVSGNGHPWSTGAYSTDIGERAWKLTYSDRADWPLKDKDLYPPSGRIWDECERKGVSYASYYFTWTTDNTKRHMSEAWAKGFDKRRDFENADLFIADLKRHEVANDLPKFMFMSLREDHTSGTTPGAFTPKAAVASNDLGVGKIVEACSHSKYWREMAIFVIEDDAQDGPDHVDAHRTEGLVISPYTRLGRVDSTIYTTTSMLRTMELILGLPPMTQYDAAALPMYNIFRPKPDLTPYKIVPETVDLMAKNDQNAYGAKQSRKMDFSVPDNLTGTQVVELNHILWHSIKGTSTPYPAPTRRVSVAKASGQDMPASASPEDND